MSDNSRFKVNPDPPEAGETLEITYVGPATEIEYQVDGQDPITVTPNDNGKVTIDPLPSGQDLYLSDNLGLPGYLHRDIVNLDIVEGDEGK